MPAGHRAPVLTHTAKLGMQQLDHRRANGWRPTRGPACGQKSRLAIAPRNLAQTGALLEYDGRRRIKYFAEGEILDLILKMFDLGLGPSFAGGQCPPSGAARRWNSAELAMVASRGDDQIAVRGRKRST